MNKINMDLSKYKIITCKKTFFYLLTMMILSSCNKGKTVNESWIDLFDGESLTGWTIKGGDGSYEIQDNTIVGITKNNTANTFLVTDKTYGDFILELDAKIDSTINSGIQIRSNILSHYRDGKVHGYQVEIDPSDRSWSGGIYDESRRGWLNTLENNPEAQKAFKQNEWNHFRIEAIGDTIKTWINETPASYLIDDMTQKGFIGLQVHGIKEKQLEGSKVMFKNIKILTDSLSKYSKKSMLHPVNTKNELTHSEIDNGWELLWDGETTNGWRAAKLEEFPENGWEIKNGELSVLASEGKESAAGGDIVTKELFGDFALKVDFKIYEGDANSGIKYYVDTDINKGPGSSIGLEYQILGSDHPDYENGSHPESRKMASLYDLIKADPIPVNPVGQWNTAKIVSQNNHVEHYLNGIKVLEYERGSEDFRDLVKHSKYKKWKDFGELKKGQILLQEHGDRVSFKNIKIKKLN